MKKISFMFIFVFIFALAINFVSHAAPIEADGRYEVPVVLWHSQDDKTSFGNSYILPTALIEKNGDSITITITTNENVRNFRVWYYTDGSVAGSNADAEKVTDVLIAGKVYSEGYRFPLVTDSEFAGVKFKASIMPMSPSARLKIDFAAAVSAPLPEHEPQPEPEPQTEAVTVSSPTSEVTVPLELEEDTTEIIEDTSEQTTEEEISSEPETEEQLEADEEEADSPSSVKYIIISALALAFLTGVAAFIIIKKRI